MKELLIWHAILWIIVGCKVGFWAAYLWHRSAIVQGKRILELRRAADEHASEVDIYWADKTCSICGESATLRASDSNPTFYCNDCWEKQWEEISNAG